MEPWSYGEMVADRIREARMTADQERRAAHRSVHATIVIPGWRVALGRQLVSLGDWVAGCAELARGEIEAKVEPQVRLAG